MIEPVRIVPSGAADARLWGLVREFADLMADLPWTLIGGMMVRAIEAEHGASTTTWVTVDVDAVLDVRAVTDATKIAAQRLIEAGFEPVRLEPEVIYRFKRGDDVVDVLAPDHLGSRASLVTVPPERTLEIVGGRQAVARARDLLVGAGDWPFAIPIPSLMGAVLIKARAAGDTYETRAKHERDLARLLVLIRDPTVEARELTTRERAHLGERTDMTDPSHRAWTGVAGAEDGAVALEILIAGAERRAE